MENEERLDFLVYYRKQLQIIIDKLDKQIEKLGGVNKVKDKNLMEDKKDLKDPKFLEIYVANPGVIEVLNECRNYMKSIPSNEQDREGRLYYSNPKHGENFAMIALSPKMLHLYFAPRLGIHDKLPDEAKCELKFGKSLGDRWDKFQITTPFQAKKAISYIKPYLEGGG
jgi:hypothetical protein